MLDLLRKYLTLIFLSAFKFELGPIMGIEEGLSIYESIVFSIVGMMSMVFTLTYGGGYIKKKIEDHRAKHPSQKKKKIFTKKNRLIVKVWRRFGVKGVSILTPILFGPPLGMVIILSLGGKKKEIIKHMLISAVIWSVLINIGLYYFGASMGWLD